MSDDDFDMNDKGGFLILPAIGVTLVAAGIFIIVVGYYPEVIPYLITSLSYEPLTPFLLEYYEEFKPEMLPHPYMLLIGLSCIGGGSACMIFEYREELQDRKAAKEQ